MREPIKTTRFKLAALEAYVEKSSKQPNEFEYEGEMYRFTIDKFYLDDQEVFAKDLIQSPEVIKRLVTGNFGVITKI